MSALYNENDPYAAQWLRNLVEAGHIAPGTVSAKSIVDLEGRELAGFRQAHFFAGIGVWSAALRAAGWPDDWPVWTGSCPCQPFSGAGQGRGFDDPRHLWPNWFSLIREHRPPTIFGEQVEGPAGRAWLDLVFNDLEEIGYAVGAVVFPAAGVGAPHGRHRTYWVANAADDGHASREKFGRTGGSAEENEWPLGEILEHRQPARSGDVGGLADAAGEQCDAGRIGAAGEQFSAFVGPARHGAIVGGPAIKSGLAELGGIGRSGPPNGFWRDPDWIFCRDNRWRPIEPGSQPLAHGAPARVGKLRAYGNAIVLQQAQAFIEAFLEVKGLSL